MEGTILLGIIISSAADTRSHNLVCSVVILPAPQASVEATLAAYEFSRDFPSSVHTGLSMISEGVVRVNLQDRVA